LATPQRIPSIFLVLGFDEVFFQWAELLIGQLLPQKEFL